MVGILAPIYSGDVVGVPQLTSLTVTAVGLGGYQLQSDGDIATETSDVSGFGDIGDWLAPKSGMALFEVRATLLGWAGSIPNGGAGFGAWFALSGTNTWEQSASGYSASCGFTIEIRRIGTATVLASATITMNVADGEGPPP